VDGKVYQVPEAIMSDILKVINALPYGQVALLANAIGQLINEQQEDKKSTDEGT
jgi:hypothetical protein